MIRQSEIVQNSWATLANDTDRWGWDTVYPSLKKSENWTPPTDSHIEQASMVLDESLHGLDGPIHYSYPGYFYESQYEWIPTLANMGVETRDPAGGQGWGSFIATSAINPTNVNLSFFPFAPVDCALTPKYSSSGLALTPRLVTSIPSTIARISSF